MPIRMLWGHGSYRGHYGGFKIPPHVEVQFFCPDNAELDDDAIAIFERHPDLAGGITAAMIAAAARVQPAVGLISFNTGDVCKNYVMESIVGDFFAAGAKVALSKDNVWSPGWEEQDGEARVHLKDWIGQNARLGSAANPLVVQWGACRSNYAGTDGDQVAAPLPMPVVRRKRRCYITTATCTSLGLPDDCAPLTKLRWFRDHVMEATPQGRADVAQYYAIAPRIVDAIEQQADAAAIYRAIFDTQLQPALRAIDAGAHREAHALYRQMTRDLQHRFCQ